MGLLELRIPPLAILLVTALLMTVSAWALPAVAFSIAFQELIALVFGLAGATTSILGVLSFRRAGTTVNPLNPDTSSSLVRSGVYKLSRNPMYLGFLMLLLAWGIYLSNALALLFLPVFVVYMNRFQIKPEERALTSRFGQEFVAYTRHVRRWL
jgi:protein-S-isoprenylcysteine O-methyltransferase Ste14